jgi:ketosteroid isomerase-like protein
LLRYAAFAAILAAPAAALLADPAQEIADADRAYNELAGKEGMLKASLAYASPHALYLDYVSAHLEGAAAVQKVFGTMSPTASLSWSVEGTSAAASGDLGYTIGAYVYRQPRPGQADFVEHGHYCTIWKKQPDGSWKFTLDTGQADKTP